VIVGADEQGAATSMHGGWVGGRLQATVSAGIRVFGGGRITGSMPPQSPGQAGVALVLALSHPATTCSRGAAGAEE